MDIIGAKTERLTVGKITINQVLKLAGYSRWTGLVKRPNGVDENGLKR